VIAAFEAAGIDAYTFKTQITAKYRRDNGITKKTDAIDAECIFRIGTEQPTALKRFGPLQREDELAKLSQNGL
jgi:hypothetical protein